MMPAAFNEADVQTALKVVRAMTPAEVRALDAFNRHKQVAEDSLRQFVEQGWDVLEPGTKFIPAARHGEPTQVFPANAAAAEMV